MKYTLHLSSLALLCGLVACQPELAEQNAGTPSDETCRGKCDGVDGAPQALASYSDFGISTCDFLSEGSKNILNCAFGPTQTSSAWQISEVEVRATTDSGTKAYTFRGAGIDGTYKEVARYYEDEQYRFPVDVETIVSMSNGTHTVGYLQEHGSRLTWQTYGNRVPFSFKWAVSLREFSFVPSPELIESGLPVSVSLESELPEKLSGATLLSNSKVVQSLNKGGDARQLISAVHAAPFVQGSDPMAYTVMNGKRKSTKLRAAGHYVIQVDGSMVLTATEDLPVISSELIESYTPPCELCTGSQVCVSDMCVERDTQTQNYSFVYGCDEPVANCDAGENEDCAQGHVCVEGMCRNMECQEQAYPCKEENLSACEVDSHCAEGHVCAGQVCRDLECQEQDTTTCESDTPPCESDSDCAEGHVCAANQCRQKLKCQDQRHYVRQLGLSCFDAKYKWIPCDDDNDCSPGNLCLEGSCRYYSDTGGIARSCN